MFSARFIGKKIANSIEHGGKDSEVAPNNFHGCRFVHFSLDKNFTPNIRPISGQQNPVLNHQTAVGHARQLFVVGNDQKRLTQLVSQLKK
jgi:hypothetical protein